MSTYKDRKEDAQKRAAKDLAEHNMYDGLVRSYRFNKLGTSAYSFVLTWTPGQLVLTGDCGELTLTHYHAMGKFEEAIDWVTTSDFDYLLGKSNAKREYDQEATFAWFKHMLNEEPLNAALGSMNWVEGKLVRVLKHSQIAELRAWRKEKPKREDYSEADFDLEIQWWKDDRPEDIFQSAQDDAWYWWAKLAEEVSVYKEQYDVTKAKDRHDILNEINHHFEHEQIVADFLWGKLSMDDPNIIQNYTWHAFFQIACIQHGCRMILQQLKGNDHAQIQGD